ncbi:MAG: hypothetical protein ACOX40_01295 [Bacilli bacterium]|nr:hypothetical protein [Acholeplasmataceae bacterium]
MNYYPGQYQYDNDERLLPFTLGLGLGGILNPYFQPYPFFFYRRPFYRPFGPIRRPWYGYNRPWR